MLVHLLNSGDTVMSKRAARGMLFNGSLFHAWVEYETVQYISKESKFSPVGSATNDSTVQLACSGSKSECPAGTTGFVLGRI